MKLCVNCKHVDNPNGDEQQKLLCNHKSNISPVNGKPNHPCWFVRIGIDGCGPQGKYWEQKQQ